MSPFNIGMPELVIILVIVMFVFGAKRLPEMGKSLGTGIREFKKSITAPTEEPESDDPKVESTEKKESE